MTKKKGSKNQLKNPNLLGGKNTLPTKNKVNDKTVKKVVEQKEKTLKKTAVEGVKAQKEGATTRIPKQPNVDLKKLQLEQNKRADQASKNVVIKNKKEADKKTKPTHSQPKEQGKFTKAFKNGVSKFMDKLPKAKSTKVETSKTITNQKSSNQKVASKATAKPQKSELPKPKNPIKKSPEISIKKTASSKGIAKFQAKSQTVEPKKVNVPSKGVKTLKSNIEASKPKIQKAKPTISKKPKKVITKGR